MREHSICTHGAKDYIQSNMRGQLPDDLDRKVHFTIMINNDNYDDNGNNKDLKTYEQQTTIKNELQH